ncbi:MAG: zinc ribbon domain-containing protein [Erysipelotrichaceae bacterium]|nr:zinc ribbon domain-containing protein [Erysipelotrichaceae bacterium]
MVNCKNCGAPLSLNDAYCPHCGTPNPEAQEHLKKLKELDKSFRKTRLEVVDEVKKSKKGYSLLVILAMILLANLLLIPFHSASYEIAERIIASKMTEEEIKEKMDSFLENGDYIEMSVFARKFPLSYRDYGAYNQVVYYAELYERIVDDVSDYCYGKDLYSDPLMDSCKKIKEFKDEYERLSKRNSYPEMRSYIDDLNEEVDLYIKATLKLNDEDLASIKDLSDSQLLVLVNERLNHEE